MHLPTRLPSLSLLAPASLHVVLRALPPSSLPPPKPRTSASACPYLCLHEEAKVGHAHGGHCVVTIPQQILSACQAFTCCMIPLLEVLCTHFGAHVVQGPRQPTGGVHTHTAHRHHSRCHTVTKSGVMLPAALIHAQAARTYGHGSPTVLQPQYSSHSTKSHNTTSIVLQPWYYSHSTSHSTTATALQP